MPRGLLATRPMENPARATAQTGKSKTRRLHEAFAKHSHDSARAYPANRKGSAVLAIDNTPRYP